MNLSAKLFFLRNRIVRERILYSPRRFRSTAEYRTGAEPFRQGLRGR